MTRSAWTWWGFGAAMVVVVAVMAVLTAWMLEFERGSARNDARAAMEESVRLALWRMDTVAPALLAGDAAQIGDPPPANNDNYSKKEQSSPVYQRQLNRVEQQQRDAFANLGNGRLTPEAKAGWPAIKPALLERIRDILPQADLEPVMDESAEDPRRLSAIPARLVVAPGPEPEMPWNTPVRVSLLIAWVCVAISGAGVGVLLAQTLSLSERRGAFASAVTHELRTPLTTFRLYSELLASGVVSEPEARREYARTLVAESDRLGHLVENVLAYARLERRIGPSRSERITLRELMERITPPLARRAEQAGLPLTVRGESGEGVEVVTDVVAVQQIALNLVDNACKHGRTAVRVAWGVTEPGAAGGWAEIRVEDDGPGLGARRAFVAFDKSRDDPAPGIGLGLFLSRQLARGMDGELAHEPTERGAAFVIRLPAGEPGPNAKA